MQVRATIELFKRNWVYVLAFALATALILTWVASSSNTKADAAAPTTFQLTSVNTPILVAIPTTTTVPGTTTSTTFPMVVGANQSLQSESDCAARVVKTPENRSGNKAANNTKGSVNPATQGNWGSNPEADVYMNRVDGNYTGTTDEIIQWAACKWGLPADQVRAQVMVESSWHQTSVGGFEPDLGNCTDPSTRRATPVTTTTTVTPLSTTTTVAGDTTTTSSSTTTTSTLPNTAPTSSTTSTTQVYAPFQCATAFGLLQLRSDYQPGTYPLSARSTAYNLDYALAMERSCFDGNSWLGSQTTGDLWGCVGAYYSGDWHDAAAEQYILNVKKALQARSWG